MKKHKSDDSVKKKTPSNLATNLKKVVDENRRLRQQLVEVTEKQHQEMSRAISLKEKNFLLKNQIHEAKEEACKLRELNFSLRNTQKK
jgi:hypothetical protein